MTPGLGTLSYAALVGNTVIKVYGFQHPEMVRRQPDLAGKSLSNQALLRKVQGMKAELIRRAKGP